MKRLLAVLVVLALVTPAMADVTLSMSNVRVKTGTTNYLIIDLVVANNGGDTSNIIGFNAECYFKGANSTNFVYPTLTTMRPSGKNATQMATLVNTTNGGPSPWAFTPIATWDDTVAGSGGNGTGNVGSNAKAWQDFNLGRDLTFGQALQDLDEDGIFETDVNIAWRLSDLTQQSTVATFIFKMTSADLATLGAGVQAYIGAAGFVEPDPVASGHLAKFDTRNEAYNPTTGENIGTNGLLTPVISNQGMLIVPEPATMGLLGLGLIGLVIRRKKA